MPNFEILKAKDPSDKIFIEKTPLFNIPFKIAIVGKSQISLGKSTIIMNLLLRKKFYRDNFKGEDIYFISPNKLDKKLKIVMEELEIPDANFMDCDEGILHELYEILEDQFLDGEKQPKLIVFDDCAFDGSLKNSQTGIIAKIVMNGRHANISSIFTTQKYSLIGTPIRTNLTGAMIGNLNNKELELVEGDLNFLENGKKEFYKMMRKYTKGRDFVVFNFTNKDLYLDKNFKPI